MADISDAGAEARVGHSRWCQIDPKSPGDSGKMLDHVKLAESTNSGLLASGSLALRVAIAIFRSSTAICSQQNHGQKLNRALDLYSDSSAEGRPMSIAP